jgi:phosphate:Na+ symporter
MDLSLTILNLAGSVALLLWGVHMARTGVQRAFGAKLRSALGGALRNRLAAFAAGLGVTAVLQSSTATGLMVASFAAGGFVDLTAALAVMLGANVGTTLIVQALSFDVAEIAPALILVGVILFRRAAAAPRDLGRAAIGLGLMLMALHQLLGLLTPYEDVPSLRLLLGAIATEPVLDVIVAAGLTWATHSSAAVVLVIMSLAAKGTAPARRSIPGSKAFPTPIRLRGVLPLATSSTAPSASRSHSHSCRRSRASSSLSSPTTLASLPTSTRRSMSSWRSSSCRC